MVAANVLNRAAQLGIGTGIHSMTPIAAVTWGAESGKLVIPERSPFSYLANKKVSGVCLAVAVIEIVADKLPILPSRSSLLPLTSRMLLGGLSGGAVAAADEQPAALGIAIGAIAAAWCSYAATTGRTQLTDMGVPNAVVGLVEDLLAVSLALAAVLKQESTVA